MHSDHGSRSPSHSPHLMSPTAHLGDASLLPPITTVSQQYRSGPPLSTVDSIPGNSNCIVFMIHSLYWFCFFQPLDIPVTSSSCLGQQQPVSQCCYIDQVKNLSIHADKAIQFVGGFARASYIQFLLYDCLLFFLKLDHQGN